MSYYEFPRNNDHISTIKSFVNLETRFNYPSLYLLKSVIQNQIKTQTRTQQMTLDIQDGSFGHYS